MNDIALFGILAGLKFSIFLIVLVFAFLADIPIKKTGFHWINAVAVFFIVMSLIEMLHIFALVGGFSVPFFSWLGNHYHLYLVNDSLFLGVGISFFAFLKHINKNLKDYK